MMGMGCDSGAGNRTAATILAVALVVVAGSGCMIPTYSPPGPAPERAARRVAAPFDRTWNAVIDMFAARNIPISTIDKSSGFIATQQLRTGKEAAPWADCGSDMGIGIVPTNATYNVLVRGDSTASTVRVTVSWAVIVPPSTSPFAATPNYQCVTTGVWEDDAERTIAAAAQR